MNPQGRPKCLHTCNFELYSSACVQFFLLEIRKKILVCLSLMDVNTREEISQEFPKP